MSGARRRPKVIQRRAKNEDPGEELELIIVQSMWLTGFDSPPLHTLFLAKPMRGAALMQALARVNRTFRDKRDGLLVGYAPLTENLYAALAEYTINDRTTRPVGRDTDEALARVRELHDVIGNVILGGYDWRESWRPGRRGRSSTPRSARRTSSATRPRQKTRWRTASPPWPTGSAATQRASPGSTRCARLGVS
jgi:hypothetical protein